MNSFWMTILYVSFQSIIFKTVEGVSVKGYTDDPDQDDTKVFSAKVVVHGNPRLHDDLMIHVTTEITFHNLTVRRVKDSVLHPDAEGFVISGDEDGKTVFDMHQTPRGVHDHALHFFSDPNSGTIVSVVPGHQGNLHVEGLINDVYIIAPPGSARRHRRALKADEHTVYKQSKVKHGTADFLEVPKIFSDKSRWVGSYRQRPKVRSRLVGVINKHLTGHPSSRNVRSNADTTHSVRSNAKDTSRFIRSTGRDMPRADRSSDQATRRNVRSVVRASARHLPRTSLTAATDLPHLRSSRPPSNVPATVEVLIIIDREMFQNFNFSMTDLGLFLLHYWHAVNFKFQTMKDPEVRLRVRQYGAFQYGQYQPFIENNRIENENKKISLYDTLKAFRNWMKKYESNKNFVRHDIAVLQTGEDLCEKTATGECFKLTSGIGFVSGACITARSFPDHTYDVAISEIGKSFKGVLVMVHEIGHLLGSHHDGEGDSKACPTDSGYVMSYQRDNAFNFSRFSNCSRASIKRFLSSTWYSQCLRETDTEGYDFPSVLPGQYMGIQEQCRHYVGGKPCPVRVYPLAERCERLCCEANGYRIKRREPTVDGTDCGGGKVCFNGECLPKSEIPS